MLNILSVQEKIKQFYLEDNHYGDLATSIFDTTQRGTMNLIAKESGIFCGEVILHNSFTLLEPEIAIELYIDDGDQIQHGQHIAKISGKIQTLLTMERIVLNLIQRMSGIATKTHQMVELIQHTSAQLVDTRKTTPGLGMIEKYAVRVGGGVNHRRTLNDGIMLKDNHIAAQQSLSTAVAMARQLQGPMDKIEVEIEDETMLQAAIAAEVDVIMFDNRQPAWIAAQLSHVPKHIKTEASGNIQQHNIVAYAETGVDYISVGSLFYATHALDISAKVVL